MTVEVFKKITKSLLKYRGSYTILYYKNYSKKKNKESLAITMFEN